MNYTSVFIAFFLLIGAISAVPSSYHNNAEKTTTCSKMCLNHESNLFKEIGSTHHFNYETSSEIELETGQKTHVNLKAKVDISTISKCEHQMNVRKVQITGPKDSEIMEQQIERFSTRFSQDNSKINSICFDESEENWVLNLKKAILSSIQVTSRQEIGKIVEKDVLGYCSTKYEQISSNTLQKTKFLNTCTKRSQTLNSILTGDFNKQKKSTCKIQLDNQMQNLKSVVCEETNSMLPFSHSKSSGQVSTITKLTLERIENTLPQVQNKQWIRDSLQFNKRHFNKHNDQDSKKIAQAAKQILDEINSNIEHNVQKETPEKIRELSEYLAVLNVQELENLANQVSNKNDKLKDIFFDTVAQTGTQETAHIILKAILNQKFYQGEISNVRKAFWLSMLSNSDQITDEILSISLEHIKNENLPRQALFSLTSMINEIKNDEEIRQDSRYQQIVDALIEKLNRQSDEKEKIVILKALRNTGILHQNVDQIFNIIQNSREIETRIAAIQVLEQDVFEEKVFKKLMKIFENNSNEAEERIAAFQVLVNNQEKVREIYNVLTSETNKQVGSYVVSYFKNARDNQLPKFETLRRIASTFDLPESKFERNDFRQSKHIQFTQQIEKLDLGAQVEADLVFDEQKQLRNVRARFDLNKENLQMKSVEITMRTRGLPEMAQQMLQELIKQTNMNEIVDEIKQLTSIRSKQQLNQKINRFIQLFKLNNINLSNERLTEQIDASIYVRVEEKTVLYINLKDIQDYATTLQQYNNQREQFLEQIIENLTGDNAITLILSNRQNKMPTHGLPMHTGHSLIVVARLKTGNGEFYPSIATDFHYEMGFTIKNIRPAVHYHVQMHSAPGLRMKVDYKNSVPTKLQISMPENRLQMITIKSFVNLQTSENKEVELNVSKKQKESCTKMFNQILGAELCQKIVYPKELFEKNSMNPLFNGPIELSLYLEKTDSSIKYWEMIFEKPSFSKSYGQSKALYVAFNTVGSRKNRELSARIELNNEKDSKVFNIDLRTPVKSAKIEVRTQWTSEKVGVKTVLMLDNQRFEAEIGSEKINQNGEQQYVPSIKLVIPGSKTIHYTGKIAFINLGKKESFQIEFKDAIRNQPFVKVSAIKSGKIGGENFKLATDLQASFWWFSDSSFRFVSNIDKSSNGLSSDLEIIHSINRQAPTTYKWKLALKDLSNNQVSKYNADFELNVPNTEFQNIAISYNFVKRTNQEIENELTAFWNNQNGQKVRQIHILQQSKMNKPLAKISSQWENLLKIEIVPFSTNYEIQGKTNWQKSQQKYNVQLTARDVETDKQYRGEMSYHLSENKPFKMNLEGKIMIENNEFKITHNIEERENQQYHGRTMIQLRKGKHIDVNYVYRMKEHSLKAPRLNHELDAEVSIPSESITMKCKYGLKMNANQFELKNSFRKDNAAVSDVKILLNKNGESQLLLDNPFFQIKVEGDLSSQQTTKRINVLVNGKEQQLHHQSKFQWSGKEQIQIESKTTKNQQQLADFSVDYQKNQKAEARIEISQLGELNAKHQYNSQQWGSIEIKTDYFSKPIRQNFSIEKNSNKYTVKSKTHQNQQVVGELDLEVGSSSFLKVSAFDWKLSGKVTGKEIINLSLENSKKNVREELELQYKNNVGKTFVLKHLHNQDRTSKLFCQLSTFEESKLQFDNKRVNFEILLKPVGQEKNFKFTLDDKKNNLQHMSELRYQDSTLFVVLEHVKDNQNLIKHNSKLSINGDSYSKTETKKLTVEASYKAHSSFEFKFNHENGLKHLTNIEIVNLRNKVGKISSTTTKKGQEIVNLNLDVDSVRKMNIKLSYQQNKEIKCKINLKDQPKFADLSARFNHFEIKSNWNKESHKDQKYNLEIVDKKNNSRYNLFGQYQRKTMLNIKIESSRNGQTSLGEFKLHKDGEAFFKLDSKNLKLKTELDFNRSPLEASLTFENKQSSLKHQTTVTFLKKESELKIKSTTDKNSKQIANINLRINPTTKQIFADGEVDNKNLKIEGNVNNRYSIDLKSEEKNFKHSTELDLNAKTFNSETIKSGEQVHKIQVRVTKEHDVDGSMNVKEHELIFKSNQQNNQYQLDYNNRKINVKSTGHYTISRRMIGARINAEQRSKQLIDLNVNLNIKEKSFDGKMNILKTKSNVQINLVGKQQKLRVDVEIENQEKDQKLSFKLDTTNESEKQISAKFHSKNLKFEKEIKLVNNEELRFEGQVERNGHKLAQGNVKIAYPLKVDGKVNFNTRKLEGHALVQSVNVNELKFELFAKDSQGRKVADLKSKLTKFNNKMTMKIDFDSQKTRPYTLTSELKKESNQLTMNLLVKSEEQKVGNLDARIRLDGGMRVDAELNGEFTSKNGKSEIVYKFNNLDNKYDHILRIKRDNYTYGYEVSCNLKHGKILIHLPNRIVELRYDVSTQANGHVLVNLQFLPDVLNQKNNVYDIALDNLVSINHQEFILNIKTVLNHPEIHHPIEMVFRSELRELHNSRPLVFFVSYDASSNQQQRISCLYEILNESNERVSHFNISRQNQTILDIHYRWAVNYYLVHQQLNWSILNQHNQKTTGELLAQINLKQKQAKFEMNNKHKLQINWEKNFDKNTIVQIRAQTDNLVRKMKIMTKNENRQIEIRNYENEKIVSTYELSILKEKNTLWAIEMHKKQGNKLEKVAFIQLVKDSLNYAKVHLKAEKSLIYEVQNSFDHLENKIRSITKRNTKEISSIVKQQYQNLKLDEQTENTAKYWNKASQDLSEISNDYLRLLEQYLPNIFETVKHVYQSISQHMRQVYKINLEEKFSEMLVEIAENLKSTEQYLNKFIEMVKERLENINEQYNQIKKNFNRDVAEKLSMQVEEGVHNMITFSEKEGEKVYEFLHENLKYVKMNKLIESIKSIFVKFSNQIKKQQIHLDLNNLVNHFQNKFEGKFNLKDEIIGKVYFPTSILSKLTN